MWSCYLIAITLEILRRDCSTYSDGARQHQSMPEKIFRGGSKPEAVFRSSSRSLQYCNEYKPTSIRGCARRILQQLRLHETPMRIKWSTRNMHRTRMIVDFQQTTTCSTVERIVLLYWHKSHTQDSIPNSTCWTYHHWYRHHKPTR